MINKNHESQDQWRILIAGAGGQGVITAARMLTDFFLTRGDQVLSGQLHGMAQRGGSVQSTVMVNCGVSPAIPEGGADIVVGFEPVETVRALPYISSKTSVFLNTSVIIPFVLSQNFVKGAGATKYPDMDELKNSISDVTTDLKIIDAAAMAKDAGTYKALNMVMLGCLFGAKVMPYAAIDFQETAMANTPPKFAEINNKAFTLGVEFMN